MRALVFLVGLGACDQVYGLTGREPIDGSIDGSTDGARDAHGDAALPSGLVAHYRMDGISNVLEDNSGNDLVGLCHQSLCPTETAVAKVGSALHFDGTMAIGVNPDPKLETTAGFTVAGWYRLDDEGQHMGFECPFNKVASGGANTWQLCFSQDQQIVFFSDDGTSDAALVAGSVGVGRYHHVVLWWDGQEKRIYVDGLFAGGVLMTTSFTNGIVAIGADFDDGEITAPFRGELDDLRIYDRALDVGEIAALIALGED